jgi:predicted dehydrogenase
MGRHHVQEIRKFPYVGEMLGCDLLPAARASAKKDGIKSVATIDAMLAWKPDAALVVTDSVSHRAIIEPLLKAGVPVLTEKPLAITIQDCRSMVALASRMKVPFQVGFELPYCGFHRAMKAVVDSGLIGKPLNISQVQLSGPHPKGYMTRQRVGGIFWEKLCHQIDIWRYWLGEPERIMAIAGPNAIRHYGVPDNVLSSTVFPGGRVGNITFMTTRSAQIGGTDDYADRGHFFDMCLTCTKGSVSYSPWTDMISVVRFNHRGDCKSELVERFSADKRYPPAQYNLKDQDGDFLSRVRAGRKLQFPAADALISFEWVARAEKSLAQGGKWITAR